MTATDPDVPTNGLVFSLIGAPEDAAIDSGTGEFTWTPQDGWSGATITVQVTDDGSPALADTTTFFVEVRNVAPTAVINAPLSAAEGSAATVSLSNQYDPSAADRTAGFHYAYDLDNDSVWEIGDGTCRASSPDAVATVPASLLDDGPGSHTVRAWIIDDDGGHTEYSATISIENVAPIVAADGNTVTVVEGQTATHTGIVSDPGGDSVTLSASIGTILDLLFATNTRSWNGVLYDLNMDGDTEDLVDGIEETLLRTLANDVYRAINEKGDI